MNVTAEIDGVDLRLEVRGAKKLGAAGRTLGFSAERVEPAADPLREHEAVRDVLIEDRQAAMLGPRRIVLCNAPKDDEKAGLLWDLLTDALNIGHSRIEVWRTDRDALAGDYADQRFRREVAASELVIVALSNSWGDRSAMSTVVRARLAESAVIPVLLRATSTQAAWLDGLPTYPRSDTPFAAQRAVSTRDKWVNGLAEQIHRKLAAASSRVPAAVTSKVDNMGDHDLRALKSGSREGVIKLQVRPSTMDPDLALDTPDGDRRVDVVAFLSKWARNPDSAPLAALLGEYGTGKTITCQGLTEVLRTERTDRQPEPLYFDLRRLGNVEQGVPTLPDILTECIKHGWSSGDSAPPSGEEVLAWARKWPTLFVIDGLDEVLVRLDAAQGIAFTHELLKLRPIRTADGTRASFAGVHTKVLLSCRTHYFRSLREQSRHFLEHDRDLAGVEDYVTLLLLPLTDEQIRSYLEKALPERDATQVMDMLRAVHDLSDLATRPYTLSKVVAQIPFIEKRFAQQRPVHAATIYRQVLHDWLARDHGKHRMRPDHKLTLMARLAAWSWERGDRRLDSADLDDWLDEQLATDLALSRRYQLTSRDQLEEDLRTATFVVRSDRNGPDRPDFQFAHSSIHEYFLAQHLCDALRDDRRADWCLREPSVETLDFLGQLITDDEHPETLMAQLARWRAPYLAGASELWLRYALHAREHDLPHPTLTGSDLSGAKLRSWQFTGTEAEPLAFTAANLTGADLRDTRWDDVNLTRSTLDGAQLDRAVLHRTNLTDSTLPDANLSGAFLHYCRLDGTDLAGANTNQLRHVGSGTDLPSPPVPARTSIHLLTEQSSALRGVAYSPDGTHIATASGDNTARIWDTTTGEHQLTLTGHTNEVNAVAYSPDGTHIATASADDSARTWNTTTGEHQLTLTGHTGPIWGVAYSPDGTHIATASADGTARTWNTTTGEHQLTLTGHTRPIWGVAYSPDGTHIATASADATARTWNTTTGEHQLTLTGHTNDVNVVTYSPDGTHIATASDDATARTWNTTTGEHQLTLTGHTNTLWTVAYSPDGTQIASASADGTARIWNTTTGEHQLTLTGHTNTLRGVAYSPDGTHIATASDDATARTWDTTTGEHQLTLTGHTGPFRDVRKVVFSPDGTHIATASGDNTARIWDTTTGEHQLTLTGHTNELNTVVYSPDGTHIATASDDTTARTWNTTTGEHQLTLTGHTNTLWGVAYSPDGTHIATASDDGTARTWNTTTGEHQLTLTGQTNTLWGVAYSPDGTHIATAGNDYTARIWDTTTGEHQLTLTGHTNEVNAVAYSPDGTHIATASDDNTARTWNTTTGEHQLTLTGHTGRLWEVAYSPDGTHIATASGDNTARIWDTTTGEHQLTLTGHTNEVNAVAYSPDGTHIATASDDNTARTWNTTTGQQDWLITFMTNTATVSWSPADNRVLSITGDAWRYVRAACFDDQDRFLGLQPYERYYPAEDPS
ncbi:pentapeptide repeat-containing protein [Amycolatopsis sp., V23-08]|uniref:Pentapeptide repeat-containing protein n=1 Tax=Amycolatopsis heterodermiae TaxID=3110235 RepID=A0ABU5QYY9_9PSEU|nr:pentapeptide repeat-containing protein [Amycolatopsis sp., V23-08]MEA5359161.1 pentapeptide repeat-containing protein [Amycolatopsis sp., V23-08]